MVCRNLRQTLRSLVHQTSANWRSYVCCQDIADGIDLDPRIIFLKSAADGSLGSPFDRELKLAQVYRHMMAQDPADGYVMRLDADDVAHPDLVRTALKLRNPAGYLILKGYMLDVGQDRLAYLHKRPFRFSQPSDFHKHCGSAALFRVDFRKGDALWPLLEQTKGHSGIHHTLACFGMPVEQFPFPAMIYPVNHGNNWYNLKGKGDFKIRYAERHAVGLGAAVRVRRAFRLSDLQD